MQRLELVEHALISADDKTMVRHLGHGLSKLGGWELHSYGRTKATLEGTEPAPDTAPPEADLQPHEGIPVSGVSIFVGGVDENKRDELSTRLTEHLLFTPEELAAEELPAIDLVYMNPRPTMDKGYVAIMEAAIDTGRIVIAKMRHVDPVLDWLGKGRPEDHAISIEVLADIARTEIDCYLGI